MSQSTLKLSIITVIIITGVFRSYCQGTLPEVFQQGSISDQINYIGEHTRIYENYRAIREDIYQKITRNVIDTLMASKRSISGFVLQTTVLSDRIDSLYISLEASNNELKAMIRTKNSIRVLGMEVNKTPYNTVMWTIILGLVFLLVTGFLSFKRNRFVTLQTKKDLDALKEEFEQYRAEKRLEREKMTMDHFNEIKKLKGGYTNRS